MVDLWGSHELRLNCVILSVVSITAWRKWSLSHLLWILTVNSIQSPTPSFLSSFKHSLSQVPLFWITLFLKTLQALPWVCSLSIFLFFLLFLCLLIIVSFMYNTITPCYEFVGVTKRIHWRDSNYSEVKNSQRQDTMKLQVLRGQDCLTEDLTTMVSFMCQRLWIGTWFSQS
jgi:hypothetical protein